MIRQTIKILIITSFLYLITCQITFAQGVKQEGKENIKGLQGEVTWIRKDRIAIVYKRDLEKGSEDEILLPVDKNVTLERAGKITDIVAGDTVYIQFAETVEESLDGPRLAKRVKKITLVKKGTQKSIPAATVESPGATAVEEGRILTSE